MTALRAQAHGPALFLILALVALALAVGLYFGGVPAFDGSDGLQQIQTDLLNHKGAGSGKACEPQGRYGHVRNPPSHCTP